VPLAFLRRRAFTGATIVGFTTSFGMFAVFFFSALYLQVVAQFSGWKIALQFLPMSVAMILAGILAGRLTASRGARVPMVAGCAPPAAACSPSRRCSTARERRSARRGARARRIRVGLALVAVTASILAAVPAERSGMAASTVNTARELAASSRSRSWRDRRPAADQRARAKLSALGVPSVFHALILHAVTRGGLPANTAAAVKSNPIAALYPGLVARVLTDAKTAFGHGVHTTLVLAGAILLVGGVVALATESDRPADQAG